MPLITLILDYTPEVGELLTDATGCVAGRVVAVAPLTGDEWLVRVEAFSEASAEALTRLPLTAP